MKHLIRLRPSPAMVVACLALGLALGGTSYAAIKLPKNSVGAKQLKKNAVTSPKIKANAVTGADVKSRASPRFRRPLPPTPRPWPRLPPRQRHDSYDGRQRDHGWWSDGQAVLQLRSRTVPRRQRCSTSTG